MVEGAERKLTLTDIVLLAAAEVSGGNTSKKFTAEELLVAAWNLDNSAFGLRGFESAHPDSNKLYTKTDGENGLVKKGMLNKEGDRVFSLTQLGLESAAKLKRGAPDLRIKLERGAEKSIAYILNHRTFLAWREDHQNPTRFTDAGLFWNIAPGTPGEMVYRRVSAIDNNLAIALRALDDAKTDVIYENRDKPLFERKDVLDCMAFQKELKQRFRKQLEVLDKNHKYD